MYGAAEERKGEKTHNREKKLSLQDAYLSHPTRRPVQSFSLSPLRACVCGCGKFTSASIGERLHPRHASSLSGQERDGEQKDGGEGTGGRAEVHVRGASVCGAVDLGWGLSIKLRGGGVRGEGGCLVGGIWQHPNLSCPPFSLALSVSLVVPRSLSISHPRRVSQRFPWRPGGCGAAAEEKEARA